LKLRGISWLDWYDVGGIALSYGLLAAFALAIVYRNSDFLWSLSFSSTFLVLVVLTGFWQKFSWGVKGSLLLLAYLMAILLTPPYSVYQCYLKPIAKKILFKGG
jgi:hypothetical protein